MCQLGAFRLNMSPKSFTLKVYNNSLEWYSDSEEIKIPSFICWDALFVVSNSNDVKWKLESSITFRWWQHFQHLSLVTIVAFHPFSTPPITYLPNFGTTYVHSMSENMSYLFKLGDEPVYYVHNNWT